MLAETCGFFETKSHVYYLTAISLALHGRDEKACFTLPIGALGPMASDLRPQPPDHVTLKIFSGWPGIEGQYISVQLHDTNFDTPSPNTKKGDLIDRLLGLREMAVKGMENTILIPRGTKEYVRDDGVMLLLPEFEAIKYIPPTEADLKKIPK